MRYSTCNYSDLETQGQSFRASDSINLFDIVRVINHLYVCKVIGTDTYRSATYDFLLTFHSNHGLSRTISEIDGDFSRKSQNFPTPCILSSR